MRYIHTKNLILRPCKEGDAEAMYENWTCDARVAEHCRWHPHENVEATENLLKMYLTAEYCWAITLKEQDEPIGCIDVVDRNGTDVCEIGYVLSYKQWGKGIMTEAVSAVIEELFHSGFHTIGAFHNMDNPASGRVLEKCGMVYVCNRMEQKKFDSDERCEVKCYEIRK